MTILQGGIILLPYPFNDIASSKQRPAMVLSVDSLNHSSYIVAKITSNIHNDRFSFSLQNSELTQPLKYPSEVRINELFTAHHSLIIRKFGSLKP